MHKCNVYFVGVVCVLMIIIMIKGNQIDTYINKRFSKNLKNKKILDIKVPTLFNSGKNNKIAFGQLSNKY